MKQYTFILLIITLTCFHSEEYYGVETIDDDCKQELCVDLGKWTTNILKGKKVSICANQQMIGGYEVGLQKTYFRKKFRLHDDHNRVTIKLQAYMIDSWDNERFQVKLLDDNDQLIQYVSNREYHVHRDYYSLYSNEPVFQKQLCGNTQYEDKIDELKETIDHTGKILNLEITSTLDEHGGNESFGFNNIEIITCNTFNHAKHCDGTFVDGSIAPPDPLPTYPPMSPHPPMPIDPLPTYPPHVINNHCVKIYSECFFQGIEIDVCTGIPDLHSQYQIKQIKSILFPEPDNYLGITIKLYSKKDYKGKSQKYKHDEHCILTPHSSMGFAQIRSKIFTKLIKNNKKI